MSMHSSGRELPGCRADTVRLFAAVELPDALRARLVELKKDFPGIGWMSPENMHLTLRFIGEIRRGEVNKAQNALRKARVAPFSLCIQGLGWFEKRYQNVLWAGLIASPPLFELKRQLDEALTESIGLKTEHGRFSPHITLSRIRTGMTTVLREQLANHSFASSPFTVDSFTLFRSVLSSAGASHSPLERYPFLPSDM